MKKFFIYTQIIAINIACITVLIGFATIKTTLIEKTFLISLSILLIGLGIYVSKDIYNELRKFDFNNKH